MRSPTQRDVDRGYVLAAAAFGDGAMVGTAAAGAPKLPIARVLTRPELPIARVSH